MRLISYQGLCRPSRAWPIFLSPATRLGAEGGFQRFAFIAVVFAATCVILTAAAMVVFNVI
jgi:hypothetical protein